MPDPGGYGHSQTQGSLAVWQSGMNTRMERIILSLAWVEVPDLPVVCFPPLPDENGSPGRQGSSRRKSPRPHRKPSMRSATQAAELGLSHVSLSLLREKRVFFIFWRALLPSSNWALGVPRATVQGPALCHRAVASPTQRAAGLEEGRGEEEAEPQPSPALLQSDLFLWYLYWMVTCPVVQCS